MGVRIKQLIGALAAAAAIGLGPVIPAHAASIAVDSRPGASVTGHPAAAPAGTIRAKSVNLSVDGGSFKGTMYYSSSFTGKNYEFDFSVSGTLRATGGTSYLYVNYTCVNPQAPRIGETAGTENISWESQECSQGISNMRVELSFVGPKSGGVTFSPYL